MPKLLKIVFTFKFHPLHAKISTPTGTPVPDEKVKELSSTVFLIQIALSQENVPFTKKNSSKQGAVEPRFDVSLGGCTVTADLDGPELIFYLCQKQVHKKLAASPHS